MKPHRLLLAGLALLTGAAGLRAQGAASVQSTLSQLKPTHFWTFDRSHRSVGSAGAAQLDLLGGRFASDADGRESGAQGFDHAKDGLVFEGDPITGGGVASTDANGAGSIFLLFRALDGPPRGQRFLFSQGGKSTETQNALGLFIQKADAATSAGDLIVRVASKQAVVASADELAPAGWYFFALTWDEARRSEEVRWFFGALGDDDVRSGAITLSRAGVIGNDGHFSIGFSEAVDSSAFRESNQPGAIDAFAIFDRELTAAEIAAVAAAAARRR